MASSGVGRDGRGRNWTCLVYPDSAPDNWKQILDEEHIVWICSPLHDKDVNPDGEKKKPHWHIALLFDGKKSEDQVKELLSCVTTVIPKPIASIRAMVRYFVHLDNPEKYQYSISNMESFGGADLVEYMKPTLSSVNFMASQMIDYIKQRRIISYASFVEICHAEHPDDWFPVLMNNVSHQIYTYIKCKRQDFIDQIEAEKAEAARERKEG